MYKLLFNHLLSHSKILGEGGIPPYERNRDACHLDEEVRGRLGGCKFADLSFT